MRDHRSRAWSVELTKSQAVAAYAIIDRTGETRSSLIRRGLAMVQQSAPRRAPKPAYLITYDYSTFGRRVGLTTDITRKPPATWLLDTLQRCREEDSTRDARGMKRRNESVHIVHVVEIPHMSEERFATMDDIV